MRKTNHTFLAILLLLTISAASVFGQSVIANAENAARSNYLVGDYEKAASYLPFIVQYYAIPGMPAETEEFVFQVAQARYRQLNNQKDWESMLQFGQRISEAPQRTRAVAETAVSTAQKELAALAAEEKSAAEQQAQLEREAQILQQQEERRRQDLLEIEQRQQALLEESRLQGDKTHQATLALITALSNQAGTATRDTGPGTVLIIVLAAGGAAIILFIIFLFLYLLRHQRRIQKEQMENTMRIISMMGFNNPELPLSQLPLFGSSTLALDAPERPLLANDSTAEPVNPALETEAIKRLINQCHRYSVDIDTMTGRKNASRQISELVLKISREKGYYEQESALHFAAALVYDIGFLNIDPELFKLETLTEEQFEIIQTHTTLGANMLFFVDEKWRPLFIDAVKSHHENMDGSGYPAGIKSNRIPFIARAIRVAESYYAQVSRRVHSAPKDRDAATAELISKPEWYDKEIVSILNTIV